MEMRREERINRLRQSLKRTDKLHLKDAAALLGVSEMTVRRDLSAESASVMLLGGYVVTAPRNNAVTRYFVSDQQTRYVDKKAQANRLAAALIEPDETLFFDSGTATPFIIDAIDDDLAFTAVCYSLNTFWRCGKNCAVTQYCAVDNIIPRFARRASTVTSDWRAYVRFRSGNAYANGSIAASLPPIHHHR